MVSRARFAEDVTWLESVPWTDVFKAVAVVLAGIFALVLMTVVVLNRAMNAEAGWMLITLLGGMSGISFAGAYGKRVTDYDYVAAKTAGKIAAAGATPASVVMPDAQTVNVNPAPAPHSDLPAMAIVGDPTWADPTWADVSSSRIPSDTPTTSKASSTPSAPPVIAPPLEEVDPNADGLGVL